MPVLPLEILSRPGRIGAEFQKRITAMAWTIRAKCPVKGGALHVGRGLEDKTTIIIDTYILPPAGLSKEKNYLLDKARLF